MGGMMPKLTSIQLDDEIMARLDALAVALGRPRTWVIEQAIARYLDADMRFLEAVEEGIRAAEAGEVFEHEVVIKDLEDFWQRKAARD
jgi:predicted transcriptional regulator